TIREHGIEQWTLVNVNVPVGEIRGVSITHVGRRPYMDRIDRRMDPWGKPYYWLCGSLAETEHDPGSDVHAILEHRISVTPIHLDLTAGHLVEKMRGWELDCWRDSVIRS